MRQRVARGEVYVQAAAARVLARGLTHRADDVTLALRLGLLSS